MSVLQGPTWLRYFRLIEPCTQVTHPHMLIPRRPTLMHMSTDLKKVIDFTVALTMFRRPVA